MTDSFYWQTVFAKSSVSLCLAASGFEASAVAS